MKRNILRGIVFLFSVCCAMAFFCENLSAQNGNFIDGIKFFNLGQLDSAKIYFVKSLDKDSTKGGDASYYYLAKIAMLEKAYDNSEKLIQKAIDRDTLNLTYQYFLAQLYIEQNRLEESVKAYEKLIAKDPKKIDYYYSLAELSVALKDIPKAKRTLDKIENMGGKNDVTASVMLKIFRMEDNWDGAIEYLTAFDKEQPSMNVETVLGDLYMDRYKDSLAMVYYDKALSHNNNYPPAIYGKAEIYRLRKDYKSYFEYLNKFVSYGSIDPKIKVSYLQQVFQIPNLIKTYPNQTDSLIYCLDKVHPSDTLIKQVAISYYLDKQDNENAERVIKRYTLNNPSNTQLGEYLSFLVYIKEYLKVENLLKGTTEDSLSKLFKKYPKAETLNMLAYVQFMQKKYDTAIDYCKDLEKIAVKKKDKGMMLKVYAFLGDLYHETDNDSEAFAYYKKALKIKPNDIAVLNNYAYYLSLKNKSLKKAYDMSRKTVEAEPDNPTYLDTFGWILFLMDKPLEAKSQFKHAMLYGGKESVAILDHYAEVLYKLKEYDLAFIYWNQAKELDKENEFNLEEKIRKRKALVK